jgi:prophage DNA circulation protein
VSDTTTSWLASLQPASWRGVPFAVRASDIQAGRKTAVHEYPFRDVVWVEDLGKKGRRYSFRGFVVGNDCYQQEMSMLAAAEASGTGTLVHPSLGQITVSLVDFSSSITAEQGGCVEYNFSFIQGVAPLYPASASSTQSQSDAAADDADMASSDDFGDDIASATGGAVQDVSGAAETAIATVAGFAATALAVIGDVNALALAVVGIIPPTGFCFGRYANGNLAALPVAAGPIGTVASQTAAALSAAITTRTAIAQAADGAVALATTLTSTSALAGGVQALTEAVRNAAVNPADQVRILCGLAPFSPTVPATAGAAGATIVAVQAAAAAMCRRASLTSLARACALYQPASYQDATALLAQVTALMDAEIQVAADAFDTESYGALRQMRTAVVTDLLTRAASLPPLIAVVTAMPMPALVEAYALYGDATRSDELVQRAAPINPLFLATSLVVLSQ